MPGLGQVTFIELAIDCETHSGRSMPALPGAELQAIALSLHERARLLRTALSVLNKHVATGALVQGTMTLKARSLVPLGADPLAGLTARPYFTRRNAMMCQLQALASCCDERWAAKIGQGLGFRIRIGTQEQPAPSGRRLDRLNADIRRQTAHRLTESVAFAIITSKGGGGGKERPLCPRLCTCSGGTAANKAPLCCAPAQEKRGAAATGGAALSRT